jgi:hypothetical protein
MAMVIRAEKLYTTRFSLIEFQPFVFDQLSGLTNAASLDGKSEA